MLTEIGGGRILFKSGVTSNTMFHLFEKISIDGIYIIAEMSANHGGSLENALEIVKQAAAAGADCLKIQTYTADSITIDCNRDEFIIKGGLWDGYKLYDLYSDAGTPYEWQETIKAECEKCGIDFLSTPFDNAAVDFLESIGCEAYKIASFELVDIPLIEYAASKGKPMIISCGMGSAEEIQDAVDACRRAGNEQIVLLKCCSEYPANWKDMHIANIPDMKNRFGAEVGLSDHSKGHIAAVAAVAAGACVIEKHVKLDGVNSADSEFSMSMDEFAAMVKAVRAAKQIIGEVHYGPTEGEKASLVFRRSLYAVKDIRAGEVFTGENVRSIRPSAGLKPKYRKKLIGKTAVCNIKAGTPISMEMAVRISAPELNTERLKLTEITEKDAADIVEWRSDPNVYRYFVSPHRITLEEHLDWFRNRYIYDEDRLDWIASYNNEPIGVFGIKRDHPSSDSAEISYILSPVFYGKGFAGEAVKEIIQFCKKEWKCCKATAEIHKENAASIHFIERLGFVKESENDPFVIYSRKI